MAELFVTAYQTWLSIALFNDGDSNSEVKIVWVNRSSPCVVTTSNSSRYFAGTEPAFKSTGISATTEILTKLTDWLRSYLLEKKDKLGRCLTSTCLRKNGELCFLFWFLRSSMNERKWASLNSRRFYYTFADSPIKQTPLPDTILRRSWSERFCSLALIHELCWAIFHWKNRTLYRKLEQHRQQLREHPDKREREEIESLQ